MPLHPTILKPTFKSKTTAEFARESMIEKGWECTDVCEDERGWGFEAKKIMRTVKVK